jgi:hypothetical protein
MRCVCVCVCSKCLVIACRICVGTLTHSLFSHTPSLPLSRTSLQGANVLLRLGGRGQVYAKLADFGLTVKQNEAATEEGGMRDRGTPRYM